MVNGIKHYSNQTSKPNLETLLCVFNTSYADEFTMVRCLHACSTDLVIAHRVKYIYVTVSDRPLIQQDRHGGRPKSAFVG